MPNKKIPINYASRDYETIKSDLIQIAKKYYPNNFKDFSEAGFGSFVLDTVAYIGDILSFYLDYQANETYFDTANEYSNLIKLSKQMGFKLRENPSSQGLATFFILVPADSTGLKPDSRYIPILKRNSTISTKSGIEFTLIEDVFFNKSTNEYVVGQVNEETGIPISYVIRSYGRVISGTTIEKYYKIDEFKRFLKIPLGVQNIAEVVSVEDSEGHIYYEVDYLSQDVIYKSVVNRSETNKYSPSLLKPFNVPRRFIVDRQANEVFLQFGSGRDASGDITDSITDPAKTVLQFYGKDYIPDSNFDPTNLIESDTFGIVPENTTLKVVMRVNSNSNVNAGTDSLIKVNSAIFEFNDLINLDLDVVNAIKKSIESTNEEPILGDVTSPTIEDFKTRVINSFASQNRAVTQQDYESLIYKMPPMFGSIKRVRVVRDPDSFKRNLNIYIISEDEYGKLINTNSVIKENLRIWLNKNRMINDTIDLLDAKIINFGIDFEAVAEPSMEKYEVLTNAISEIKKEFSRLRDIGEPFFITDVYSALKKADGVLDVTKVNVVTKIGGAYSDIKFNIQNNLSPDGRYVIIPDNVIFEIKYPDLDIKGAIR